LLADDSADPLHVAADMLSQAEHDELAAALCVTTSLATARKIQQAVEIRLKSSKRQAITLQSLKKYGAIIVARREKEMVELANAIAPEHIELLVRQPRKLARQIRNAGAIFLGPYSAPPLGDYLAGPNHVLPTGGSARFFSPLGTYDFLKLSRRWRRVSRTWRGSKGWTITRARWRRGFRRVFSFGLKFFRR
jgi:histidinol dehydrogenase